MLLNPASLVFIFFLMISVLLVVSSSSWFMAWLALEVNMMSFIPLMMKKKNKYTTESALKYFLVQALASTLIIVSMTMSEKLLSDWTNLVLILALSLKVGLAPFHQWVPSIIEGLTWSTSMIFFIVQKINPILLLSMCPLISAEPKKLIFFTIIMSSFFGSVGGLNQVSLRKIIVYSSIAHLAWMMSAIYMASSLWILYYIMYSIILFCGLNLFSTTDSYMMNHLMFKQKFYKIVLPVSLMSLSGLPPFSGFIPKLMIMNKLINELNTFIFLFLLSSAFISMFFYMRVILTNTLMFSSFKINLTTKMSSNFMKNMLNTIGLMSPMIYFVV